MPSHPCLTTSSMTFPCNLLRALAMGPSQANDQEKDLLICRDLASLDKVKLDNGGTPRADVSG